MRQNRTVRAFTLVELLVVISIILVLVAILLPALSGARESAKSATCGMYLKTFGTAFEMRASNDPNGARTSGAFDHLRDGDVRDVGWVADVINLKVGTPGKMLCPANKYQINEKVADYTGAATTGTPNPGRAGQVPPVPVGLKSKEMWQKGYNTNYAASWHFVRGDPTADDGYGSDGDPSDPSKCPNDGDGPLNAKHLGTTAAAVDKIAILGDARVGDSADSTVTASYAQKINEFAGTTVVRTGDYTLESFTDGMSVDYSGVTGNTGQKGHEFNDIAPLHKPKSGDYIGGYANILFADGHVAAVADVAGANGNQPDGFLGPYKVTGGNTFAINQAAFDEITSSIWYGRLRPKSLPGGGSIE